MKEKLLLTVAAVSVLAVVAGVGAVATAHWNQYQNKQKHVEISQAEAAKTAQYNADRAQWDLLARQYNAQQLECQKGVEAYALLTTALKTKAAAPVCAAPVKL